MSRSRRAPRRRSRQTALQALYAADLAERARSGEPIPIGEVFECVAENFDLPKGAREFAARLAFGTVAHLEEIDALLAKNATNWKVSRMAAVDRNVLRLAIYELTQTDTPISVVLDEAIVLARRFGAESSAPFVNGVLDAVARQVRRTENAAGELNESGESG